MCGRGGGIKRCGSGLSVPGYFSPLVLDPAKLKGEGGSGRLFDQWGAEVRGLPVTCCVKNMCGGGGCTMVTAIIRVKPRLHRRHRGGFRGPILGEFRVDSGGPSSRMAPLNGHRSPPGSKIVPPPPRLPPLTLRLSTRLRLLSGACPQSGYWGRRPRYSHTW